MANHIERPLNFYIITCSDTRKIQEDTAGDALEELIKARGWNVLSRTVVIDDEDIISMHIEDACDGYHADIVITCGGTGLSSRDVAPEATKRACFREIPGVAEHLRAHSRAIIPFASLSHATCGQRGKSLVVNMPGSKKAVVENWEAFEPLALHAVSMMRGAGH